MLVAHIITQSSIMCIQSVEAVLFIAIFFNVTSHGSTILVVIIIVLLGFAGMLFGKENIIQDINLFYYNTWIFICRFINFNLLQFTYNGQLCGNWCILSNDYIVRIIMAIRRNAKLFKKICINISVYNTSPFNAEYFNKRLGFYKFRSL